MKPSLFLFPLILCLLAACGPQSTDPREGGLFSYSPKAYEQRLKDRRETLGQTQEERDAAEQQAVALEREAGTIRQKKTAVLQDLDDMGKDLDRIEAGLISSASRFDAHAVEKQKINKEITAIREQLKGVPAKSDDVKAQEQEAQRLRQRLQTLMAEAEALMNL